VAGLPPSAGFFGKVELFRAGIAADSAALVALVFAGGALSFVYMLQIYQHNFWRGVRGGADSALASRLLLLGLAGVVVLISMWPEPLLAWSREAASALPGDTP
jgi:multicomponent Na+:H+ antiporter subunit D